MAVPQIQGNLPFQSLAEAGQAFQGLGGSPQQAAAGLGPAYGSAYKSALDFNTANYGNILSGYQSTLAGQQDALSSIGRGYTDLSSKVLGGLEGAGASERQAISDRLIANQGAAGQSLVSRGLGNSTVVDSTNRGLQYDAGKQYLDLADRLMQQRAGYTSQLGLAGLAQQQQSAMANSGLAQNQLGFMERVNAPYPDAGMFSQLAQQYGMAGQADKDRNSILGAAGAAGRATPQSAGTVSRGGGGFFTQPSDFQSGGTYQPQSFYGGAPQQRSAAPPLGAVSSAAAGNAAQAYFQSGLREYIPPSGTGFAGGVGGGMTGRGTGGAGYDLAGEDMPYGGAAPDASYGGYSPYGSGAAAGPFGGQMGYDPSAYGLTQSDLSYYGY